MGDQRSLAYLFQALGIIACYQKNYAKARTLYAQSLQLLSPLDDKVDMAECILSIGRFLGVQGYFEQFARLLGVAEGAVPNIKKKMFPLFHTETEKFITNAHAALGADAYNVAHEAGRQMSLDEAVAYAWRELQ